LQLNSIPIQQSKLLSFNKVDTSFIRFDAIHPLICGNKWFKLKEYLQDALQKKATTLVTFGGAFSNHIIATASFANMHKLLSYGIIRGEKPKILSQTLLEAEKLGMQLVFVARNEYKNKDELIAAMNLPQSHYVIQEGGFGFLGAKGVESMYDFIPSNTYSHIICACGTGTTFAGLVNGSNTERVEGIVVLKGYEKMQNDVLPFINKEDNNFQLHHQFHVGGYAKYNNHLLHFMNQLFIEDVIKTDFVYTGKMAFATYQLIEQNYFKPNNKLLLVHSGGLQGNAGLNNSILCF
jgi:1-aminocyclopropane-1-carboxylate deaminase